MGTRICITVVLHHIAHYTNLDYYYLLLDHACNSVRIYIDFKTLPKAVFGGGSTFGNCWCHCSYSEFLFYVGCRRGATCMTYLYNMALQFWCRVGQVAHCKIWICVGGLKIPRSCGGFVGVPKVISNNLIEFAWIVTRLWHKWSCTKKGWYVHLLTQAVG